MPHADCIQLSMHVCQVSACDKIIIVHNLQCNDPSICKASILSNTQSAILCMRNTVTLCGEQVTMHT